MFGWSVTGREAEVLKTELGPRVLGYLDIENSSWCYKMWFMTTNWWWDEESRSFVEETRPEYRMDEA